MRNILVLAVLAMASPACGEAGGTSPLYSTKPGISGVPGRNGDVVLQCFNPDAKLVNGVCIPRDTCIDQNGNLVDGGGKDCVGEGQSGSRATDLAGAERLHSAGPYHRPGDMSVGNGLCFIVDESHLWVRCWQSGSGGSGSGTVAGDGERQNERARYPHPHGESHDVPCDPGYALLAYPGTWTLVCARDLQEPK